jgi:hypothetical protein
MKQCEGMVIDERTSHHHDLGFTAVHIIRYGQSSISSQNSMSASGGKPFAVGGVKAISTMPALDAAVSNRSSIQLGIVKLNLGFRGRFEVQSLAILNFFECGCLHSILPAL